MIRYLFLIIFSVFNILCDASAQVFKKIKVTVGVPFSAFTTDQFAYYAGLDLEPSWRIKDDLTLGFYIGYMQSDSDTNTDPQKYLSESGDLFSTCLVIDRYFTLERPNYYYGLMVGLSQHLYQVIEKGTFVNGVPTSGRIISDFTNGVNISPRLGFNYGHFRAMIMYQLILNDVPDMLTLQVGLEIGGGKISK
ncbi:MAG: hypothetical protein ACQETL_09670 [Bacteroidota bacterium]